MFEEYAQEELRQVQFAQGLKQGALDREREIARAMLADGMTITQIARLTGLSEAEIDELRAS